jgi:hypothetical protein
MLLLLLLMLVVYSVRCCSSLSSTLHNNHSPLFACTLLSTNRAAPLHVEVVSGSVSIHGIFPCCCFIMTSFLPLLVTSHTVMEQMTTMCPTPFVPLSPSSGPCTRCCTGSTTTSTTTTTRSITIDKILESLASGTSAINSRYLNTTGSCNQASHTTTSQINQLVYNIAYPTE